MHPAVAGVRAGQGVVGAVGGGSPAGGSAERRCSADSFVCKRAQTRTEHLRLVAQYVGWRSAGVMELKELDEFLLARAMEHESRTLVVSVGV